MRKLQHLHFYCLPSCVLVLSVGLGFADLIDDVAQSVEQDPWGVDSATAFEDPWGFGSEDTPEEHVPTTSVGALHHEVVDEFVWDAASEPVEYTSLYPSDSVVEHVVVDQRPVYSRYSRSPPGHMQPPPPTPLPSPRTISILQEPAQDASLDSAQRPHTSTTTSTTTAWAPHVITTTHKAGTGRVQSPQMQLPAQPVLLPREEPPSPPPSPPRRQAPHVPPARRPVPPPPTSQSELNTFLHKASNICDAERAGELLALRAEVNAVHRAGLTALHMAMIGAHERHRDFEPVAKVLLQAKADIEVKDDRGRSPLFFAKRNRQAVVDLIRKEFVDDSQDVQSPLGRAVHNGHAKSIDALLAIDHHTHRVDSFGDMSSDSVRQWMKDRHREDLPHDARRLLAHHAEL